MRWILNNSSIAASVSRLQSAIRSARSFWRRSREVSGDSISANEIDTTEPSWIYRVVVAKASDYGWKNRLDRKRRAETRIVNVPPSPFALTCEDAGDPNPTASARTAGVGGTGSFRAECRPRSADLGG